MPTRKFVNRERELAVLEECWSSKGFEFVGVWGRRRVGKTELLKKFLEGKPSVYLLCADRKPAHNLKKFSAKVCEFLGIPAADFRDFADAFQALLGREERLAVVLDEFGYLVRRDPGLLSDFQELVDERLRRSKLLLILCGSSISMMETRVLGRGSPLYGRTTRQLKVQPFGLSALREWFPGTKVEDLVKIYSVTGGVAKYLEFFSGRRVEEEIVENFFDSSGFLFWDAPRLLAEELRDYSTYLQVLEAIALGHRRVNEIAGYAFLQPKDVFFYLKTLSSMGVVRRLVPLFSPKKAKRGLYEIWDPYFNFWFAFVSPFQAEIEGGVTEPARRNFQRGFQTYLGRAFERLVLTLLPAFLPFRATRVGGWWGEGEEIDLVAAGEAGELLFGECKWQEGVEAEKLLRELREKARKVRWRRKKEHFAVFAKSFKRKTCGENELLFDLSDLERAIS